jgi:hypothetical protein
MATASINYGGVCAGGGHHTLTVTAGAANKTSTLTLADFNAPITQEELDAFMKVALRGKKAIDGLTNGQLLSQAQAGITITISSP